MVDGIFVEESIKNVVELYSAEAVGKSVVSLVGVIDGDSFDNVVVCNSINVEVTVVDDSEDVVEPCDCEIIPPVEFSVEVAIVVTSLIFCVSESVDETSSDIVGCVVCIVSAVLPKVPRVDEDNNISVDVWIKLSFVVDSVSIVDVDCGIVITVDDPPISLVEDVGIKLVDLSSFKDVDVSSACCSVDVKSIYAVVWVVVVDWNSDDIIGSVVVSWDIWTESVGLSSVNVDGKYVVDASIGVESILRDDWEVIKVLSFVNVDVVCAVVEAVAVFVVWPVGISTDCWVVDKSVVLTEDITGVESVVCCVFVVSTGEDGNDVLVYWTSVYNNEEDSSRSCVVVSKFGEVFIVVIVSSSDDNVVENSVGCCTVIVSAEVCVEVVDWFSGNVGKVPVDCCVVVMSISEKVCVMVVDWTSDNNVDEDSFGCCVVLSLFEEVCILVVDWFSDNDVVKGSVGFCIVDESILAEVCLEVVDWSSDDGSDEDSMGCSFIVVSVNCFDIVVSISGEACIVVVDWISDDNVDEGSVDCCVVVMSIIGAVCFVTVDWSLYDKVDDVSVGCVVVTVEDVCIVVVVGTSDDNVDRNSVG